MAGPNEAFLEFVRNRELAAAAPTGPANTDIAKYILAQTTVGRQAPQANPGSLQKDKEPSLMGRLFDLLSRSNYAVAEFAREWAETGDPDISALGEGFSGKKKTTFSDFLAETGMEEGFARSALGLGLDIFADPLTYVPIAGVASKLKKAKEPAPTPKVPLAERMLREGEPVNPELFNLPSRSAKPAPAALRSQSAVPTGPLPRASGVDLPMPTIPGVSFKEGEQLQLPGLAVPSTKAVDPTKAAPAVDVAKAVKDPNQYSLLFGKGFGVKKLKKETADKAENIVDGLAQGAPGAVAKVLPKPLPTPKLGDSNIQAVADDILNKFNPEKSTAKLNKAHPDTLNAKQQRFLWEKARGEVQGKVFRKNRKPADVEAEILANTAAVYKRMEDALIQAGKVPRLGSGENVKLSDIAAEMIARGKNVDSTVLSEFASEIKKGSDLWNAVQGLRAKNVVQDADTVKGIVDSGLSSRMAIEGSEQLSRTETKSFEGFLKKYAKDMAKSSGISPASVKATGSLLEVAIKSGKSAAEVMVESRQKMLNDVVASGKNNPKLQTDMVIALEKNLGKLPPLIQGNKVADNKAVDFIMGRTATWWGQKDLRPMTLNWMGSGYSMARARGQVLDKMFQGYTDLQRSDALKIAQGLGKPETEEIATLARSIQRFMDNTIGHSMGQSVVFRAGINMDMLNKWLSRHMPNDKLRFSKKTKHPLTGEPVDLSKEADWIKSWQYWNLGDVDPKRFLFNLQEALSTATVERAMFDDLATRFGSRFKSEDFTTRIEGYPYLEGVYFPKDIAQQVPRAIRDWTEQPWSPSSKFGKFADRLQSMWKSAVTIYRPGHHVRNMTGDAYLGWMDGVNSIKPYRLAARVQRSMGSYETMQDVDRLIEVGLMPKHFSTPAPGEVLFRNKSGVEFSVDQIKYVADQKGLLEHTTTLEDIIDMGDKGSGILNAKPLGGKVQRVARRASELQSHNARLAHFIDKVMKSRGSNLDEIFEHASRRARKFHPTGLDLTQFEKKYMRRLMPFYSWMRKSTPLLMESLVMKPGKTLIPAKVYGSIQEAAGIETGGRDDPFPVDQLFPSWVRDQGLGPLSGPEGWLSGVSNQNIPGYVQAGMGVNPLAQLGAELSHPGKTLMSSLSPMINIPQELLSGRKTFTGEPITGDEARPGAFEQYVGENIPMWQPIQSLTGITPFGGETKRAARGTQSSTEAFANWLTGLGIQGTGQYVPSARFEARQEGLQQRRMGREEFFKRMRELQNGG